MEKSFDQTRNTKNNGTPSNCIKEEAPGLVHIYTGNGKGKTTAAVGLGVRAAGCGKRVLMVQFLKGGKTGEIEALEKLKPGFVFYRGDKVKGFIWNMTEEEKQDLKNMTVEVFRFAYEAALSGEFDMIIMDEIMGALSNNLLNVKDVEKLIKDRPEKLEIVMTGRNAPEELIELSDYVSEINPLKHPFEKGIPARKGIEF